MKLSGSDLKILERPKLLPAIVAIVLAIVLIAGYPIIAMSDSRSYKDYASTKSKYMAWKESTHKNVACVECHGGSGLVDAMSFDSRAIGEFYKKYLTSVKETSLLGKPSKEACLKCHERPVSMLPVLSLQIPHRAHPDINRAGKNCIDCHKWLVHKESYQTRHKKQPLNAVCLNYACHAGAVPKSDCTSCHHRASVAEAKWIESHRKVVEQRGENSCFDYCHNADYCSKCHTTGQKAANAVTAGAAIQPGDLIAKHTNLASWITNHGKEALADTAKCLNCHVSIQFCSSCHKKRPVSHGKKEEWISVHKRIGKEDKPGCLACHQEKTCDKCHQLFREKGL